MDPRLPPSQGPLPPGSKPPPVWLMRVVSAVVVIAVLIVAIFLGGVILVTGAVLGAALWGWLWWQRRKLMKRMAAEGGDGIDVNQVFRAASHTRKRDDNVIEGDFEVVDERDERDETRRR